MNILFANIPFVRRDNRGRIHTGPNAGSRWPWTTPGITNYACFPFFMAYAVRYLLVHGIEAGLYDGVALHHFDDDRVRQEISRRRPDVLFLETSTPLFRRVRETAQWARRELACRIVLVGPHVHSFAQELILEPWVDFCAVGEYELASLDIARRPDQPKRVYGFQPLPDIDLVAGQNFVPERPLDFLENYWDPSMLTPRPQLAVSTTRGCPFKCTYCQWPKVMNGGRYRARSAALVLDEIRQVIAAYRNHHEGSLARRLSGLLRLNAECGRDLAKAWVRKRRSLPALLREATKLEIQSIFFDDDTWNLGARRIRELCAGLREIGLPWTMMGRIDTSTPELFDTMVDSGCVGMRFGVESFNQQLLDNTKKHLDARTSHQNIRYLLTRFSGLEFHFTTMKNLPGETDLDWENDQRILRELRELGALSGNIVHWQNSDCVAFPGTELWEEMVELGRGSELRDFDLYDGSPQSEQKLAEIVGWLGPDYRAKWSEYSKLGHPTHLPPE